MYSNRFLDAEAPLTEEDVGRVEEQLGSELPQALRQHYLFVNGGYPERPAFRTGTDVFVLHGVMPMKHGANRFEETYRWHKIENPWIPAYLVPFGFDEGGELFCMSTRPAEYGAIYHFWTEFHDDLERALTYLAPSLREFIEGMTGDAGI